MSAAIFLRNHDRHADVLRYDPATGAHAELPRAELAEGVTLARGFYVNVADEVVGVYASPEGPTAFKGATRYGLTPAHEGTVESEGAQQRFTLWHAGEPLFSVHYPKPGGQVVDAWSDEEEMEDFFLWLASSLLTDNFHSYYKL